LLTYKENTLKKAVIVMIIIILFIFVFPAEISSTIGYSLNSESNVNSISTTVNVNAVNGVATFSVLAIDKAGTAYTLTATSGSLVSTISETFTNAASGAIIVTVDGMNFGSDFEYFSSVPTDLIPSSNYLQKSIQSMNLGVADSDIRTFHWPNATLDSFRAVDDLIGYLNKNFHCHLT
jgi:uncharacterized membrane protein YbjE (DUF340 family)